MTSSIAALARIAQFSPQIALAGLTSLMRSPRSSFACLGRPSHPILVQKRPSRDTHSDSCVVFISGFHGRPFGSWGLADFSPQMDAYRFLQPSSLMKKFDFKDMAKSTALVLKDACNEHKNVVVVSASASAGLIEGAFNELSHDDRLRIKGLFLINPVGAKEVLDILHKYKDFPLLARGDIGAMKVRMPTLHSPIPVKMRQVLDLTSYCTAVYPHFGMQKDLLTYVIKGGQDPLADNVNRFRQPTSIAGRVFNVNLPDQGHAIPAKILGPVYKRFIRRVIQTRNA